MRRVLLLCCLIPTTLVAQFTYVTDTSVPVTIDDRQLATPWTGGLNTSQVNTLDLNHDGVEDVVIFDRTANKVLTYLRLDGALVYTAEYEAYFPADVTSWMLLRDFNCDGKKDLFTRDPLGIKVYVNITSADGFPQWKQFLFYSAASGQKVPVVLTEGFSIKINLQLNTDDFPAISDADGDGDLDIFSPTFPGGSTIEFHKNLSMERYGTCDSLDFKRITNTWGGVTECQCGTFAFGAPCNAAGRPVHTGGKGLLALDYDGDGDTDVLFSEENCNLVSLLRNDGDNANPLVQSASPIVSGGIVSIQNFPCASFEDVDADGKKDLVVAPNFSAHSFSNLGANLQSSTWFYKNTGTTAQPTFAFQQSNLWQREMLDVGDNSMPAFFDADADGDLDLFIGYYALASRGAVAYYENTGTQQAPSFDRVSYDFASLGFYNLVQVRPQFVDIDGDNRTDLVFTATSLFSGNAVLGYLRNESSIGLSLTDGPQELVVDGLNLYPFETVSFTDVDRDGHPDMLVGRQNRSLQYWRNTSTSGLATFELETSNYLGIGSSTLRQNIACAIGDLNNDNRDDLVFGDQRGMLTIIGDYRNASLSDAQTNIVFNTLEQQYASRNFGGRVWPAVANIFKTTKPSIIVGTTLGGLQILNHDNGESLPPQPQIDIYPNPVSASRSENIYIRVDRPSALIVYSSLGQEISEPVFFQAFQEYTFTPPANHSGMLIFRFYINGKWYSRKVIVY